MLEIESILNWIIIGLGFILVMLLILVPKDNCDMCNFDGEDGRDWFDAYSSKCLQKYTIFQENPNLPKLNITNISIKS